MAALAQAGYLLEPVGGEDGDESAESVAWGVRVYGVGFNYGGSVLFRSAHGLFYEEGHDALPPLGALWPADDTIQGRRI